MGWQSRSKRLKHWRKRRFSPRRRGARWRSQVAFVGRADGRKSHCWDETSQRRFQRVRSRQFQSRDRTLADVRRTSRGRDPGARKSARESPARSIRQNNFDAQSVACERPRSCLARESRSWHTRCFTPSVNRSHPTSRKVTSRHFRKEIVMRNFIYSLTLCALGFMQIAIVVVELTHA